MTDIHAAGANLVAITPQVPERSARMLEKRGLEFPMLHDPGNAYAAKLGLRFELSEPLKRVYQGGNVLLNEVNGDDSWTLAVPARVVVDAEGTVRAVDADPDYTRRPEPRKTLDDLAAL